MKKFSINQKFRISVGELSFFATKKQILAGVGEHTAFNEAVQHVLEEYEVANNRRGEVMEWIYRDCRGYPIQLDVQ